MIRNLSINSWSCNENCMELEKNNNFSKDQPKKYQMNWIPIYALFCLSTQVFFFIHMRWEPQLRGIEEERKGEER